jgi:hypothetical protein
MDGLKHCVVAKDIASGYVTVNWIYDDLDWARWKVAEMEHIVNRRKPILRLAIVSI